VTCNCVNVYIDLPLHCGEVYPGIVPRIKHNIQTDRDIAKRSIIISMKLEGIVYEDEQSREIAL